METGTIQKTIQLLQGALEGLHADISNLQLEKLAIMVHKAMTVQGRVFHTPEHIFGLADASRPLQALAALFHDIVYYHVDQGFIPEIYETLAPYIILHEGQITITEHIPPDDLLFALTLEVFGFQPGETPSLSGGLNEFLSALVMNKKLEGIVSETDLVKATACIEATIPFRGVNERGESPAETLACRLAAINERHHLGMRPKEIEAAVKEAVTFSNKDVENFSERDAGKFLDNTWKLLPETNPSLRSKGIYSIRSYRRALQRMEEFLRTLDPDTIYIQYKDTPPLGEYYRMVALAQRNVNTAGEYLGIKLLAAGILEALAEITGGDAPVALFLGGIEGGKGSSRIDYYLPDIPSTSSVDEGSTIFGLLSFERATATSFDMQNSPLSLFIYRCLGPENVRQLLPVAKAMFAGRLDAPTFLAHIPTPVIVAVAEACAELAITRREALRAYAAQRRAEEFTPSEETNV